MMQPGSEASVNWFLITFGHVLTLQSSYSVHFGANPNCYECGRWFSLVCLWLWKHRQTGRILFGEFWFTDHKFHYRVHLARSVLLEDIPSGPFKDIFFCHCVCEWCLYKSWFEELSYNKRPHVAKLSGDLGLVLWYAIVPHLRLTIRMRESTESETWNHQ